MSDDKSVLCAIVPCEPGWRVLYLDDADEPRQLLVCEAVLAWRVVSGVNARDEVESDVWAITTDGSPEQASSFFGFLCPDGVVERPFMAQYETLQAAQKALQKGET